MITIYINQMVLVTLVNNILIFLLFLNNNNELSGILELKIILIWWRIMVMAGKNSKLNLPNFLVDCDDLSYIIALNIGNY
ncbi:hypothetical protein CE143_18645 [Photorhabdus luminescens]|uniref:Uncharacterized protein n=1 Tax=Photorhabdus akhurstii TaxID=171438 RepID=A0ABX8M055_9GAMM|nr:hypothetical protein B0X70_18610 [Photorhabdus akhurstii]UJD76779.1 hypothetical protein CE143_18645 [Photorhabdus luminescens]